MNKIMLLGNIGMMPELKDAGSTKVLNFSLATQRSVKKGDSWEKETDWHNCVVFGKTAESIAKYCTKGSKLMLEGEMTYPSWTDKEGKKQTRAQVKVHAFEFAGEKTDKGSSATPFEKTAPADNDGISIETVPW